MTVFQVNLFPFSFWATVCKTARPMLSDPCPVCLSVCLSVMLVYCSQTVKWIKMPLRAEIGFGPVDIVLDGDPALPEGKGTEAPTFRPLSIVAKWSPVSATAELLSFFACFGRKALVDKCSRFLRTGCPSYHPTNSVVYAQ